MSCFARRPAIGRPRPDITPTIRSFPLGRYIIFYQPISGGISVIRVLHSARDIEQLLNPPR
ncbi:type II toxin-antitoxin system RelE/ParE family toxin [Massilia sp. SR12]